MKIKNLLFDFGEVLVTLSREKAVAAFRALGAEIGLLTGCFVIWKMEKLQNVSFLII